MIKHRDMDMGMDMAMDGFSEIWTWTATEAQTETQAQTRKQHRKRDKGTGTGAEERHRHRKKRVYLRLSLYLSVSLFPSPFFSPYSHLNIFISTLFRIVNICFAARRHVLRSSHRGQEGTCRIGWVACGSQLGASEQGPAVEWVVRALRSNGARGLEFCAHVSELWSNRDEMRLVLSWS